MYRLLLGGWAPNGLPLPADPQHGLAACTIDHVGPSAGQTAVLMLVDLVLGVSHGPKLSGFQREMRAYLPGGHAQLLEDVEAQTRAAGTTLHAMATADGAPSRLAASYADAASALDTLLERWANRARQQPGRLRSVSRPCDNPRKFDLH